MLADLLRGRRACLLAVMALCALPVWPALAQAPVPVRGVVVDAAGAAVADAVVRIDAGDSVVTGADGRFALTVPPGAVTLRVTHAGYAPVARHVDVAAGLAELEIRLEQLLHVDETVNVVGIRADADIPITTAEIDQAELRRISYGQDAPKALQNEPSVTWYSDSGTGAGYSYFSLRGVQQSRINITYDGAPLNDPAEHALYFHNFYDFLSEVESVQIQRGVGTSTVGAPAFGGSVNFASPAGRGRPGLDGRLELGSFDTMRTSLGGHTGRSAGGLWASGRFSYADADNYRDHSSTRHRTFFLNGGWQGDRAQLKFTGFLGSAESQLSYLASDEATLAVNRRDNPLDPAERDDFSQYFGQARYLGDVGGAWTLTGSAYYNGADGSFFLWDSPAQNELLDFGIDQGFWGTMVTAAHTGDSATATFGAHYNDFAGDHSLDGDAGRYYLNTGFKNTFNAFAKAEWRTGDWILFGDLQLRWAKFRYEGDIDLGSVDWTFVDPKAGARYVISPALSAYASVGRAQREPARLDLLAGEDNATVMHDLTAVKPEEVLDFEAGVNYRTADLAVQANLYAMEFSNEIALTGELSDIGLPIRTNVDDSYRRGFELDLRWRFAPEWTLQHNLNLSRNRIGEWTQFYDVYDPSGAYVGAEPMTYTNVRPLLTPDAVVNLGLEWSRDATVIGLVGRYVSAQQLDNTGIEAFQTPSFVNVDLRASIGLGRWWRSGGPRLNVFLNNAFDSDQLPSGYSYQFLVRDPSGVTGLDGISYFYPRATRNVMASIEFDLQ